MQNKRISFPITQAIYRPPTVKVNNERWTDPTPEKDRHAADPIKSRSDISRVTRHLVEAGRYRDNLLFVMGVNFGYRCSDLVQIKFGHVLQLDGYDERGSPLLSYKPSITLQEKKTKHLRTVFLNRAVYTALDLYLQHLGAIDFDSYLFRSASNRCTSNQPLAVRSVERILKDVINEELRMNIHASTHCLRKTFGYQVVISAPDRPRAVQFLQTAFGHSSPVITMAYIGITNDEIMQVYQNLNLGSLEEDDGMDFGISSGLSAAG